MKNDTFNKLFSGRNLWVFKRKPPRHLVYSAALSYMSLPLIILCANLVMATSILSSLSLPHQLLLIVMIDLD